MKTLSTLIIIFFSLPLFADQCTDWPRVMSQSNILPSSGPVMTVQPMEDQSRWPGDEWLVFGLRDGLVNLLRSSNGIRVMSGLTAVHSSTASQPDFIIRGSFIHTTEGLRVFYDLLDGKNGKLAQQFSFTTVYPEHKDFFNGIEGTAKGILNFLKIKFDEQRLKKLAHPTDSTNCYSSYSKGVQYLERYDPKVLEIASTWFKEAIKTDVHSPLGYMGMIDLLTFQALYNKSLNLSYSSFYQAAERELMTMKKNSRREFPLPYSGEQMEAIKKLGFEKTPNRFLAGEAAYTVGMLAAQKTDWLKAKESLKMATVLAPEDALAWMHLSRMMEKLGETDSSKNTFEKAKEINKCIAKP